MATAEGAGDGQGRLSSAQSQGAIYDEVSRTVQ